MLLARGAKVNRLEGTTGWPPLVLEIERLDPAMVELLLRNGADPNLAPRSGESLLVLAKSNLANLGNFTTPPVDLMSPRMDDAKPQAAQAIIDLLVKHGAKEPQ